MHSQPHFFVGKREKSLEWIYFLAGTLSHRTWTSSSSHKASEFPKPPLPRPGKVNKGIQDARATGHPDEEWGGVRWAAQAQVTQGLSLFLLSFLCSVLRELPGAARQLTIVGVVSKSLPNLRHSPLYTAGQEMQHGVRRALDKDGNTGIQCPLTEWPRGP